MKINFRGLQPLALLTLMGFRKLQMVKPAKEIKTLGFICEIYMGVESGEIPASCRMFI